MTSSEVVHHYGCMKYHYVSDILTSVSLNARRAFCVVESLLSIIIAPRCLDIVWNITTYNRAEIRLLSFGVQSDNCTGE